MKRQQKPISRTVGILVLGLALFSVYGAIKALLLIRESHLEYVQLQQTVRERQAEVEHLQATLDHFASGEGLELEARGRLNLQKPGEHVMIVVKDDKSSEPTKAEEKLGVWQQVINFFRSIL